MQDAVAGRCAAAAGACYRASVEGLAGAHRGVKMQLKRQLEHTDAALMSWHDVMQAWATDSAFNAWFADELAQVPFQDFFWETVPVTQQSADSQPFECVVLDAEGVLNAARPDSGAFLEHFERSSRGATVASFANLGKDAMLVSPMHQQGTPTSVYGSLAAFLRGAHAAQQDALWRTLGTQLQEQLHAGPTQPWWVNTDGRGVPWLHVRIDMRPKYYKHADFKQRPKAIS